VRLTHDISRDTAQNIAIISMRSILKIRMIRIVGIVVDGIIATCLMTAHRLLLLLSQPSFAVFHSNVESSIHDE
jgi:hypothetical protein